MCVWNGTIKTDRRLPNSSKAPRVEKVYYPGLESHQYHDVAGRANAGFGSLITFELQDADWRTTADVVDRCRISKDRPVTSGVNH